MGDTHASSVSEIYTPLQLKGKPLQYPRRMRLGRLRSSDCDMITLEIIRDLKQLEGLRNEWDRLVDAGDVRSSAYYYEQNAKALRQLEDADEPAEPAILVGRHEGRVVMIWPLVKWFSGGINQLKYIRQDSGASSTLLLAEHPSRMAWIERSFMYLISATDCDSIYLENIRKQTLLLTFLQKHGAVCYEDDDHFTHNCFMSHSLLGQAYNGLLQSRLVASKVYGYVRTACLSLM